MHEPVSSIMTTKLFTVSPTDSLEAVEEIFEHHNIHHIPVVHFKELVGLVSKSDYLLIKHSPFEGKGNHREISNHKVEEIMIKRIAKVEPTDPIGAVAEVLLTNLFHAVPVVDDNGELVGIVTTFDIIKHSLKKAYPNHETLFGN